ncbi:MAG: peptidylprolyl isomerase [Ignavibacteria bacterium]|nr:peptidylprolyl isomerase [Ignavibacteria bacterium]
MKKIFVFFTGLIFLSVLVMGCGKSDVKTEVKKTDSVKTQTTQPTQTETKKDSIKTDVKDSETKKDDKKLDYVKFETSMGTFKAKLFSKEAPITTDNFRSLVEKGFYNGIIFHRVIDGFMIQGGDPTGTGRGGSGTTIKDEFGPGLKHNKKGILSMANAGPNTGQSQFFITLAPTPHLDGKHAIFGEIVDGMSVVEKIGKTKTGPGDKPVEDVKMIKVTMVSE